MTGPKGNSEFFFPETPCSVLRGEAEGNIEGRGETKLTVSRGCYTSQLKISAYKFVAKFPEQRSKVCFAKFMEAFVQILFFAEVSQRSHGIVGRLVSRFGAFIASKLLNFFFSSCLKPFSCHDCVKNYLPDAAGKQICRGFKSARPDHVRVESSSCCCPRAS